MKDVYGLTQAPASTTNIQLSLVRLATDPLASSSVKFDYDCGLDVTEHNGLGMPGLCI